MVIILKIVARLCAITPRLEIEVPADKCNREQFVNYVKQSITSKLNLYDYAEIELGKEDANSK